MQGLLLLKNIFFIKSSIIALVPQSFPVGPVVRTLEDLQGTSPGHSWGSGFEVKALIYLFFVF